jgi:hypothetical protein
MPAKWTGSATNEVFVEQVQLLLSAVSALTTEKKILCVGAMALARFSSPAAT